jgi:predicted membrane protein
MLTSPLVGYTSIAILNSTMTLMIDIIREQSSGIIACVRHNPWQSRHLLTPFQVNIVRCGLAAALVAVIDRATQNLGYGGTYSLLGGICGLLLIGMFVEMRCGSVWRRKRDNAKVVD